ncbi:MAG: ABC transporter permease [Thermofilaceae archaeon]
MGLASFLARRVVTFVPSVIGALLITYLIAYVIPTDPVRAWVGEKLLNPETLEQLRKEYRFDAPWYEQFGFLVYQLVTGRLKDPTRGELVVKQVTDRFPITVELAIFAFAFTVLIGIPLGIIAAAKRDSFADLFVRVFALVGSSIPGFVLYYFLILLFYVQVKASLMAGVPIFSRSCALMLEGLREGVPVIGYVAWALGQVPIFGALMCGEMNVVSSTFARMWLPGFALGVLSAGFLARVVRNSLLDALSSDSILFARARGLSDMRVWRHALKNGFAPIVTILGLHFAGLLTGAIIAETVFNIPGVGRYIYQGISRLNFPVIIAGTFLFSLVYIVMNLVVDIVYALIDPRVRY